MTYLSAARVQELLAIYLDELLAPEAYDKVVRYLAIFDVWSSRMNLSTIRDPEQVVQRHFGEGLALAQELPPFTTLLDLGSGAGFPGLPIALARPRSSVTLAESQKKKAAFLKEVAWEMGLTAVKVWPDRAEHLPAGTLFDVVALRAVDRMSAALQTATGLLARGGTLAFFSGEQESIQLPEADWVSTRSVNLVNSAGTMVLARLAA